MTTRRETTRPINVGGVQIGGKNKVVIQSRTNTKTKDVQATVKQIKELEEAGCDIVRVAILELEDAKAIKEIKKEINIPIVSDIHFNPDFAIAAINSGTDKIRLNPGNIENEDKIVEIVNLCKERHIPIRIGINGGSLNKKYKHSEEAMIESAKDHSRSLAANDFRSICLSLKTSDPIDCINAYKLASKEFNLSTTLRCY